MQNRDERQAQTAAHTHATQRPEPGRNVGVRGCWELLIKIIIALILILILILWYFGRGRDFVGGPVSPYAWIVLLILILLLLWLIWLQKHFVSLTCELTEPNHCVIGHTDILAGRSLEPIIGTAIGVGFVRYELELIYIGPSGVGEQLVPDGIVYADSASNPDTTPPFGNHQVNNGTLGFIDLMKAGQTAGTHVRDSTEFKVRMRVVGLGGTTRLCEITFDVIVVSAYIKYIGGGYAPDYVPPAEQLHASTSAGSALVTVGGSLSVRGAADVFGCDDKKIAEYRIWAIPGFGFAQPANGSAVVPGGDWVQVANVVYRDLDPGVYSDRVFWNQLVPDMAWLTSVGWSTRPETIYFDSVTIPLGDVPDLVETYWNSGTLAVPSGKYTFLLQVTDEDNRTFYDIQQVWIDNKTFEGRITSLGYQGEPGELPPCADIEIHNPTTGAARMLDIRGYATDPLIIAGDIGIPDPGDTTQPTSDNFEEYSVTFRKQGAAAENPLLASTTPVPPRATWRGAVGEPAVPPVGVLATLDLSWLDASTGPNPNVQDDQRLAPGESCTYNIILRGSDKTIVSESTDHHVPGGLYLFPVKIINNVV